MYILFKMQIKINNIIFEFAFILKISTTKKSQKEFIKEKNY